MHRFTPIILATALAAATPALAGEDDAFVEFKVLKPEVALQAAQAAMEACRAGGYQVGVTVVDRFGGPQVFVRDRYAGLHVYETSRRKAWTAVSFRSSTSELHEATAPGTISQGIRQLSEALPLGGGLVIEGAGTILGGIGVSGAPSPELDDECAAAGIAAVEDQIAF
ncbi:GlcG/HbpS family heme-binding protein [Chachezhania sediminis]|uniref:GlcG/HbpS family heme-binding protein n=1 Tax=Chachezhania sediminis TaxID=2599291 RepID=UPI0018EF29B1|nr:heme-binding protein [Chachezhania sediminis]